MRRRTLLMLAALAVGCVAPKPGRQAARLQVDFRGPASGTHHEFGARIKVTAIVRGGSQPYSVLWRNVHTGEEVAKYSMSLVLDEEGGQNQYTFTAKDQTGITVSERLVFYTPPRPLDGGDPLVVRDDPPARDPHEPPPRRSPLPREPEPDTALTHVLDPGDPVRPLPDDGPNDDPLAPPIRTPPAPSAETPRTPLEPGPPRPGARSPARLAWELSSLIYNATVLTADQVDGSLEAPLGDVTFLGEVAADQWSGQIEDPTQGRFEFEASRVGPELYEGRIRAVEGEWVPLAITLR